MSIAHEVVFPDLDDIILPDRDHVYEIIDGVLVEKPHMGIEAEMVAGDLLQRIKNFAPREVGSSFGGTTGYQISSHRPKLVRVPDVSSIHTGRFPAAKRKGGYIRVVPDLAAEVISTHDLASNVEERLNDFLLAGVPLAWLIYTDTRHVYVYHQGTPALRLGPDDVLDGEDVLPGFSCPVSEIFASL